MLTKQFRPGPEKILLKLPGGFKEKDENAEEAIKRELLEETGYTGNFELVTTSFVDAYSDTVKYNFIAQNCHKIEGQNLDKSEHIEIIETSLQEFRQHVRSGKLTDIATGYLGLNHLKLL